MLARVGLQRFNFIAKLNGQDLCLGPAQSGPFNFISGLKRGPFCGPVAPARLVRGFNPKKKLNSRGLVVRGIQTSKQSYKMALNALNTIAKQIRKDKAAFTARTAKVRESSAGTWSGSVFAVMTW